MPTAFTFHTTDPERKFAVRSFYVATVVTMNRQTTGVSTGACKPVKLKICYKIIVKSWC